MDESRLGQGKYKMNLDYFMPESKEVLKKIMRMYHKDIGASLKVSHWPNLKQSEH